MKVLAIIPARSGSKSLPNKNILSIAGKPLIAYSIEHALKSEMINRVIVSTDSEYYAEIANNYGAETPFLRPYEFSTDNSNDIDFFKHALDWLQFNESYVPEILVQLRPTHPIRDVQDIDNMIRMLIDNPQADSVRSVVRVESYTPYKMWSFKDNYIKPIIVSDDLKEAYNQPRQKLPPVFFQNASVDVIRTSTILQKISLSGDRILGYIMAEEFDIDTNSDFERVRKHLESKAVTEGNCKTYCVDIDGVIAHLTPNNDYTKSFPIIDNVKKINQLYENGNYIILFTARGYKTGLNWSETTKKQLIEWGVKYHELHFGKPAADFYIDDRLININNL